MDLSRRKRPGETSAPRQGADEVREITEADLKRDSGHLHCSSVKASDA